MSELDSRPPPTRGRSTHRGGRGGFGRGGPRGGRKPVNGTTDAASIEVSLEEQGELGEMKKKYASELVMLKDMFPDWTDVDLVFALQEADGDVPATVDHITQGNVSQFAEVKSTKDRARSKAKDAPTTAGTNEKSLRGGRGRGGLDSTRGARSRASDRGRGGFRGARGGHATSNGAIKEGTGTSILTTESTAWGDNSNTATAEEGWDTAGQDSTKGAADAGQSAWADVITSEATPAATSEGANSSLIPEGGPKKSWASMFAPKPAPHPTKKGPPRQPVRAELAASSEAPKSSEHTDPRSIEQPPPAPTIQEPPIEAIPATDSSTPELASLADGEELIITPSKDPLTEENVEHLPDESNPIATQTAASTTGSVDPRNLTPLPPAQAPIGRPPMGGYATSAYRAAGVPGRSASFQRRVQEQQEAVVMPGHNAVDRATVQFGSMGLNGEPGPDVDEEREEPETRQAPQHSPPSQPRTSLPPAPRHIGAIQDAALPESLPTPKQAPGLPPASQFNQQQTLESSVPAGLQAESQMAQPYSQYGRYGQPGMQQDSGAQQQKPYDPFSHQAQPSQYDQYGVHSQQAPQQPQHSQAGFGGLSSAPNDMSHYYTSDQQRSAYSNYYGGGYGQDTRGQAQQDAGIGQQRSASGFGGGPNESAFPSQVHQQQAQSRFVDSTNSGNNTPNPHIGGPQHSGPNTHQSQQSMHQQQPTAQQQQQQQSAYASASGFPYGHPYYASPYQAAYQNQFGYNGQVSGYGGGYPAKHSGGMYSQSHGYNMGPQQGSYEQHSASPANTSAFGQNQQTSMRSASGMSSGLGNLDEYGRSSAQSHQQSSAGFGAMGDTFARSGSGFGGGQTGFGQQSMAGPDDSLKPFADSKSGPSPALGQPGARPGSAANSAAGSAPAGLPPPQNYQSGFGGGYPGFPGQSQYGNLGGLGGQQQAQQAQQQQPQHGQGNMAGQGGYGSYGASGFGQTYGGYSRAGWGANYGAH